MSPYLLLASLPLDEAMRRHAQRLRDDAVLRRPSMSARGRLLASAYEEARLRLLQGALCLDDQA